MSLGDANNRTEIFHVSKAQLKRTSGSGVSSVAVKGKGEYTSEYTNLLMDIAVGLV